MEYQRGTTPVDAYYDVALTILDGDAGSLLALAGKLPDEAKKTELLAFHERRTREAAAAAEAEVMKMTWDESTRQYRDEKGEIVTKHNGRLAGHRNAQKLVDMTVRGLRLLCQNLQICHCSRYHRHRSPGTDSCFVALLAFPAGCSGRRAR